MIDGVGAKVEGLADLTARFRRLRVDIAASDEAIIDQNAEELAKAIEAAAPRDEGVLATSVSIIKKGPRVVYVAAGGQATRQKVKRGKKPFYDYARAAEFGTIHTAPSPFFWPTYRRLKRRLRSRITASRKAIIKAFRP